MTRVAISLPSGFAFSSIARWDPTSGNDLSALADPAGAGAAYLRRLQITASQVYIGLASTASGGFSGAGPNLSDTWEASDVALTLRVPGLDDLVIPGPGAAAPNEPYTWTAPGSASAWLGAFAGLSAQAVAIFDDGVDPLFGTATTGALVATGRLVSPTLQGVARLGPPTATGRLRARLRGVTALGPATTDGRLSDRLRAARLSLGAPSTSGALRFRRHLLSVGPLAARGVLGDGLRGVLSLGPLAARALLRGRLVGTLSLDPPATSGTLSDRLRGRLSLGAPATSGTLLDGVRGTMSLGGLAARGRLADPPGLAATIRADEQRLDVGAIVSLFTLDASGIGGGVLRFVTGPWNAASVRYGGLVYAPVPVDIEGVSYGGNGPAARPKLTLSRLDALVAAAALDTDSWRGARLTRLRTLTRYLDGEPEADSDRHWPTDSWIVERLLSRTRAEVVWELASALDFDRRKLPGRQILRDVCAWRYRTWTGAAWDYDHAECPYTGANYFDGEDNAVAAAADDVCSRRLSGCKLRFPDRVVPFGGFLGVGRTRRR